MLEVAAKGGSLSGSTVGEGDTLRGCQLMYTVCYHPYIFYAIDGCRYDVIEGFYPYVT
jgi:hypothetical protein